MHPKAQRLSNADKALLRAAATARMTHAVIVVHHEFRGEVLAICCDYTDADSLGYGHENIVELPIDLGD